MLLALVSPLGAQSGAPTNARLRVRLRGELLTIGSLVGVTPDSIWLRVPAGTDVAIAKAAVVSVERSLGRRSNARTGGMVGAALALTVLVVGTELAPSGTDAPVGVQILSVAFFSGVGGGIGAVIGSAITSERWQTVSVFNSTGAGPRFPCCTITLATLRF